MDFLESFDAPVVETIGGVSVSFPILLIEDYLPWLGELKAQYQAESRRRAFAVDPVTKLPPVLDVGQRQAIEDRIARIDVGLDAVAALVWTIPGSRKILEISMTKATMSKDDQAQIQKRIRPQRLHSLASDVSALFDAKPKVNSGPNAGSPSAKSQDGATSDSNADSSNASTGASIPENSPGADSNAV